MACLAVHIQQLKKRGGIIWLMYATQQMLAASFGPATTQAVPPNRQLAFLTDFFFLAAMMTTVRPTCA